MSEGLSESRFYMWRAVFALVHADHKVVQDERNFAENYLENVPFSEEQKETLREDLEYPQDPAEMFVYVTDPDDRSGFFQFARLLLWCDGDFDRQEEVIIERITSSHMEKFDPDSVGAEIKKSRQEEQLKKMREDEAFEEDAKGKLGLLAFLRGVTRV